MRRHRTVNNSYTHIDSVNELPGLNYCAWIKITKFKLISRENALLNTRIETIQSNTNTTLESFYNSQHIKDNKKITYKISQTIHKNLVDTISESIHMWQGIELSQRTSSKPYKEFRDYFTVAKNWWDQKKTNIYGSCLWVEVLKDIQKFISPMVSTNKCLFYKILVSLFHSAVKYPNTKELPLIPNGVIKNCKELHAFLFVLDHSLNIDLWLRKEIIYEKETDKKNNEIKKRTGNAKVIAKKLRTQLIYLSESADSSDIKSNIEPIAQQTRNLDYDKLIFQLADAFMDNNSICNNMQINHMNNMNNINQPQPSNNSTIIFIPVLQAPMIPQTHSVITTPNAYNASIHTNWNPIDFQRYNPLNRKHL